MRCIVRGRVQGVWFRASCSERAQALGLRGRATNLPDGSVEVWAYGDGAALAALRDWLGKGPPMAQVDHLECASVPDEPAATGFRIG